jgi:hypothetical protein
MASRLTLILLLGLAVNAAGCVVVRQTKLTDGTPNPADHLQRLLRERRIVPHQSSLSDTVEALSASRAGGTTQPSTSTDENIHWYASPPSRRLVLVYQEPLRMYGVTSQHFLYLPVPVWGAEWTQEAKLTLSFDHHNRLSGWSRHEDSDLLSSYQRVEPLAAAALFAPGQAVPLTGASP